MDVISNFAARYERTREEVISLQDYLDICKRDPTAYATASERMLKAIGEPELVDTRNDPRFRASSPTRSSRSIRRSRSSMAWKTP